MELLVKIAAFLAGASLLVELQGFLIGDDRTSALGHIAFFVCHIVLQVRLPAGPRLAVCGENCANLFLFADL